MKTLINICLPESNIYSFLIDEKLLKTKRAFDNLTIRLNGRYEEGFDFDKTFSKILELEGVFSHIGCHDCIMREIWGVREHVCQVNLSMLGQQGPLTCPLEITGIVNVRVINFSA